MCPNFHELLQPKNYTFWALFGVSCTFGKGPLTQKEIGGHSLTGS